MTDKKQPSQSMTSARETKLAQALRRNLRRRKAGGAATPKASVGEEKRS
jgi:hypothetical protein